MTGENFLVTRENRFLSVVFILDFDLKIVKYTKDGKQCSKIIMLLYGWEKA